MSSDARAITAWASRRPLQGSYTADTDPQPSGDGQNILPLHYQRILPRSSTLVEHGVGVRLDGATSRPCQEVCFPNRDKPLFKVGPVPCYRPNSTATDTISASLDDKPRIQATYALLGEVMEPFDMRREGGLVPLRLGGLSCGLLAFSAVTKPSPSGFSIKADGFILPCGPTNAEDGWQPNREYIVAFSGCQRPHIEFTAWKPISAGNPGTVSL